VSRTGDARVTVTVNGLPRRLFLGLRVRHAVGHHLVRQIERGDATLVDGAGNRVDLDGALYDGERLVVRPSPHGPSPRSPRRGADVDAREAGLPQVDTLARSDDCQD